MPSNGQMPDLSEAELLALQEEINKEIEKEVAKMSPEEQEMFFTVMGNIEELAEKDPATLERFISGQMTKEEEEAFVNAMVPAEANPQKEEVAEPVAAPVAQEEKPVEKPKVSTKKQENARELVDSIIKETEAFLAKVETVPDASLKVRTWGQKRKIHNWKTGFTWETVRDEMNSLLKKLHQAKDGIPTNKLAYIDEIAKNESLLNNLSKVKAVFDQQMPQVRISPFETKSLDKKARAAIQAILSIEIEAIHILDIPKELDAIFAKAEPELKTLKAREEAAAKEAEKQAQQPRGRTSLQTVGKEPQQERVPSYGTEDAYQRGGGYGGYSPSYRSAPSSYGSPYESYGSPSRTSPASGGGKSSRGGGRMPREAGDEKLEPAVKKHKKDHDHDHDHKAGKKAGAAKPAKDADKKPEAISKFDRNARQLNKIADLLDETISMIESTEYLPNLRKHLINEGQPVDARFAQTTMPGIHQSVVLVTEAVKTFSDRIKDEKDKDRYKTELKDLYKSYKKKLDAVADEAKAIRNLAIKTTPEKQAAYLESPSSINELEKAIEELNKAIEKV
jgi:hypothetical protein